MAITDQELDTLVPFIAGAKPDERGEVEMYCPLHNDLRRSASLNMEKGVWYCHAGCGGGSIRRLVDSADTFVPAAGRAKQDQLIAASNGAVTRSSNHPTLADVKRWHRRLINSQRHLDLLYELRGITEQTIRKAKIGHDGRYYKIPVFSYDRQLWNVRTYDPKPKENRRKIWSVRGMGTARLYPVGVLERSRPGDHVIMCEGEWDALLTLQSGYLAATRTDGAGKPWHEDWADYFDGLWVYICSDCDIQGIKNDRMIGSVLEGVAEEVRYIQLPYEIDPKHGKDLTDYLLEQDDPGLALGQLMAEATTERRE